MSATFAPLSVTGFSGTPLVGLLFVASWCPDCLDAVPFVEKAAASTPPGSLRVYYVSSDRTEEEMINCCGLEWPSLG
jgi:thiol-disulfide isomerase/thioredoxin